MHNQYLLEASALLGLTPIVVTVAPTPVASNAASGTADATVPAQAANATASPAPAPPTPAVLAINPGPIVISLRAERARPRRLWGRCRWANQPWRWEQIPRSTWIKVMIPGSTDLTAWVSARKSS